MTIVWLHGLAGGFVSRSTSILLLGDGPETARLRRRLGRHVLGVQCARTIGEALELAQRCRFHLLVLVDPAQPWQEIELAIGESADLPAAILVITEKTRAEFAVDALHRSAVDVLLRPFSTNDLVAAIDAIRARAPSQSSPYATAAERVASDYSLDWTLEQVKRDHMARVLAACGGNKSEAARRLGISRRTLERQLGAWEPE